MKKATAELKILIKARGSRLMDLPGVGPVVAARTLADAGDVARFADRNRFGVLHRRAYCRRKLAAGMTKLEALRCLNRRISDTLCRPLLAEAEQGAQASASEPVGTEGWSGRTRRSTRSPGCDAGRASAGRRFLQVQGCAFLAAVQTPAT